MERLFMLSALHTMSLKKGAATTPPSSRGEDPGTSMPNTYGIATAFTYTECQQTAMIAALPFFPPTTTRG